MKFIEMVKLVDECWKAYYIRPSDPPNIMPVKPARPSDTLFYYVDMNGDKTECIPNPLARIRNSRDALAMLILHELHSGWEATLGFEEEEEDGTLNLKCETYVLLEMADETLRELLRIAHEKLGKKPKDKE